LLIVAICNAVAEGLIQPWIPAAISAHKLPSAVELPPSPTDKSDKKRVPGKPSNTALKQIKSKAATFSFSPDALPHFKTAVEACFVNPLTPAVAIWA